MAETISLAVLENLVHMGREDFPAGYVVIAATIPDSVSVLNLETLGEQFRRADQRLRGDAWFDHCASAVRSVRSAVVPLERNYLLNPLHPDFPKIVVEPPEAFVFDQRLFGSLDLR
jgi:RES domain-containing protein